MLVALMVLSIGLLGVAAIQLKSLQSAHAGYQRALASLAAQDAVELLWSRLDPVASDCPDAAAAASDSVVGSGDDWSTRWSSFLPGLESNPFVSTPPATLSPGDTCTYTLEMSWTEERFGNEEAPVFDYTTRLPRGP